MCKESLAPGLTNAVMPVLLLRLFKFQFKECKERGVRIVGGHARACSQGKESRATRSP
jgi:hypothetical protein